MLINARNIQKLSNLGITIRNSSTFKSSLPDTAWVLRENYKWFMPMQTRFKVSKKIHKCHTTIMTCIKPYCLYSIIFEKLNKTEEYSMGRQLVEKVLFYVF